MTAELEKTIKEVKDGSAYLLKNHTTPADIGAQAQHKSVFVVLPADGWAELKQTVDVEGVTTDNDLIVTHTKESRAALNEAGVDVDAQGNGTLTFSCEQAPTVDLTVNVMILD